MPLWILGAGGHAKVVIATARACGEHALLVADDDPRKRGDALAGVLVAGALDEVLADPAARAVIAIGDNRTRAELARRARCTLVTLIHPSAVVHDSVVVGAGSVVFAGAVLQPDVQIGRAAIINTRASIDHDCVIGDHAHVAPGTALAGAARVGEGAFLGIGTSVLPGRTIGAWATIGAGAVVTRDIPAHVTAVGVPARVRAED